MRLIDADALMQEYARFVAPSNNSDFADVPTWNDAVSLLGSAPTIEERKTGRWIHIRTEKDGNAYNECSVCHKGECHVPIIVEVPYCWNCGAKMEVEHDG